MLLYSNTKDAFRVSAPRNLSRFEYWNIRWTDRFYRFVKQVSNLKGGEIRVRTEMDVDSSILFRNSFPYASCIVSRIYEIVKKS